MTELLKKITLTCPECGMEIKIGKTVWVLKGKPYHPKCVKDNKSLFDQWKNERDRDKGWDIE